MTRRGATERTVDGRYRLHSMIGRGGAGTVWRAQDLRLHRAVAVKEIALGEEHGARSRERALREARTAAQLQVPGVVRIYDIFESSTAVFLVMELVHAPNLSSIVRRNGPLSPERAARLGNTILDTLVAAHRAGIVHRDIKPSNVLVDGDHTRLTDFGIARLLNDPGVTAIGSILGTPSYMAPEQARGERVGTAADLYGLGATLYFAVEGEAPFGANGSVHTALAVQRDPHRPPQRAGTLQTVLDALMRKDPRARPDAAAVRRALVAVGSGSPLEPLVAVASDSPLEPLVARVRRGPQARPDDQPRPAGRRPRGRARRWFLMLGLLMLALLALFVAVRYQAAAGLQLVLLFGAGDVELRSRRSHAGRDAWRPSTRCGRSSSRARCSRRSWLRLPGSGA